MTSSRMSPSASRRSSMFFFSDVDEAAATCAFSLEEHGLSVEEVGALAMEVRETVERFFDQRGQRDEADR
jgi:hypothetical protein